MGVIYNKYNELYNGKEFIQNPEPFLAQDTYIQLGEVRRRTGSAILLLENLINGYDLMSHEHNDLYYTKLQVDNKISKAVEDSMVDLSNYARISQLATKVDKVTGKGLSTNDYTMAEKSKLALLQNYTHPNTHKASIVVFEDGQSLQDKLVEGGFIGVKGEKGDTGEQGSIWLSGASNPTSGIGRIGDYYINTSNSKYFKKTNSVSWSELGTLKGEMGQTGLQGATGKSIEYRWNGTFLSLRQELGVWGQDVDLKGVKGDTGDTGASLEFDWSGTRLGVKKITDSAYSYVDLKGDRGERGDKGDRGYKLNYIWNNTSLGVKSEEETVYTYMNLQGVKGDRGDAPNMHIGNVSVGVDENDYNATITGDNPNYFVNFKLPRGTRGATGLTGARGKNLEFNWAGTQLGVRQEGDTEYVLKELKGDKGEKGEAGAPPNITIADITIGQNEYDAGATIYGTSPNLYLNLKYPKPPKGEVGATGVGLDFSWLGTQLGVKKSGEPTYSYVNLKGDKGDKGDVGRVLNQKDGSELKIWFGTQAEYNAITTKDPTVCYLIKEKLGI
ncbi:MAG: phage upper tail fiber protein [Peptostreptococcaceae bacterium]